MTNLRFTFLALCSFWLVFLLPDQAMSQTGKREDISELLEDGGLSETNNLLKFNIITPLAGDFNLALERTLSKRFTVQANAGIVLPFYLFDLTGIYNGLGLADPSQDLDNLSTGYSFGITPKFYFRGRAPEFYYLGFDYQYRKYRRDSNYDLVFVDYQFLSGYNMLFGTRFAFEFYVGLGVRSYRYQAQPGNPGMGVLNRTLPNLPFGLRIGIIL